MNTHRTAYAGRNFEYYSEDGFLGGKIAAAEVKGIQSKGVYVFLKHFALNDCETNCRAISTFVNEQAIRELYLQPFEHAVVEGNAYCVMNAFARVGVIWTGAHRGLMTDVLRGEWGCQGFGISDYTTSSYATSAHSRGTYDGLLGVLAGTDTFDSSSTTTQAYQLLAYNAVDPAVNDVHLVLAMREAAHRILYTVAQSNAMNEAGVVVSTMNWWQFSLIDGIIFSSLAALVFLALTARDIVKFKKKNHNG
jgi:beta-glucosidase